MRVCYIAPVFYAEIINQLVGLEPRSTRVTFNWHFVQAPLSMVVTASLEGSPSASQNKLLTYDLDSTLARDTACIQGLEADTTYEICLQPRFSQSSSDTNLYCMFTTTLENDGSTEAMTDCVTPTRTQPADRKYSLSFSVRTALTRCLPQRSFRTGRLQ